MPSSSCHIRWQWYIYGVSGSVYDGSRIANWTVSSAASSTVSFQPNCGSGLLGPRRNDLKRHPMDVKVVWLIVCVAYRPQLRCAGSNNGVDARHLHLLTVDLPAGKLDRAAGRQMIKRQRRTGLQLLWNPATRSE